MAGYAIQTAALMWQVYDITGSALPLAFVGLARFLPSFAVSFIGGALADTRDRKSIIALAQIAPICVSTLLWALTATGSITVGMIYPAVALLGAAAAFEGPARGALLPQVVPRASFQRAVAVATTAQQLTLVIGPAITGVVIATYGVAPAYLLHVALLVVGLGYLSGVRRRAETIVRGKFSVTLIWEGLIFIWRNRPVFGAMALDMVAVIFSNADALLPIYARDVLDVGAPGYGLLTSSKAVGMLAMAASLTLLPPLVRTGRALIVTVALYGLATLTFGLSTWFPLSLVLFGLGAAFDQLSVVMRQNIIQMGTPDELRGRVSSVNFVFIGASNQLGAVRAGLVATWADSAVFAVVSGGFACLAAVLVIGLLIPALWGHRIELEPVAEVR
jgi:MFS family permease